VRQIALAVNGTRIAAHETNNDTAGQPMSVASLFAMGSGDYAELQVYQTSGASLNVLGTSSGFFGAEFWAVWQGRTTAP